MIRFRAHGITAEQWQEICAKFDNRCACCKEAKPLTVDHIMPKSAGGKDEFDNIQPLCKNCNSKKGSKRIDFSEPNPTFETVRFTKRVKKPYSINARISFECKWLINTLRNKWGQSEADVIETAIRYYAAKEGVTVPRAGIAPAAGAEPKNATTDKG